jgi:putative transposase
MGPNLEKNKQISLSKSETVIRRQSQTLKVFELKVDIHHISKQKLQELYDSFKQAKWVINDMIASADLFAYDYKNHREVEHILKDGSKVTSKITLQSGVHQNLIQCNKQNIINLSKAKKKGRKVGRLKFKSEINCIPLKTGMLKIRSSKVVSIPRFKNLTVYGLEQFYGGDYELANCNIVRKASGIYLKVTVCFNNYPKRVKTGKTIGLDFGIKDNIITSDGEKFSCSERETDYLKFLQRKLSKKTKGSKRYYRLLKQLKVEYEHLSNKKQDACNKLLAHLLEEYDTIFFQDEQIAGWRRYNKGFARVVQHSYLGRVKGRLVALEGKRTFKISKWSPTTKFCPQCGSLNAVQLSDRVYECECGYKFDRDVHAARNVRKFGQLKMTECLEQASVETLASAALLDDESDNAVS